MSSEAWRRALRTWVSSVYWTGALVADTAVTSQHKFDWRWVKTRAWNAACLTAVVYRIGVETWPATLQATRQTEASCYDTVCGGVWCVYACVYYAVSWLDRTSEVAALVAAVTWRRRATVECMNWVTTGRLGRGDGDDKGIDNDTIVHDDDDACERLSVADVPWHAYLTVAFPVVQLVVAAAGISPRRDDAWRSVTAAVAAVASCAPVAAHGTAAALLAVANSNMRSINSRIIALVSACRHRDPRNDIARLARSHWWTTEFVTGGVCNAYSADLMAAVLLAAVRVTYVAISVFHRLTDEADAEDNARTNMSLAVVMQLIAWFGQFAYLAYTCDQLTTQVSFVFFQWPHETLKLTKKFDPRIP